MSSWVCTGKGRSAWAGLGFRRPMVRDLLIAVGLSAAVSSASFAIAAAIGVVDMPSISPSELGALLGRAVIMTAVLTPVFLCEEVGWRGYLLPRLATVTSGRLAAVATGAIHAAFHLPLLLLTTTYQSAGSRLIIVPTVMITITAGGVVYAWSRWSSGSIWPLGHARGIQSGNGSMERHCPPQPHRPPWRTRRLNGTGYGLPDDHPLRVPAALPSRCI